LDEKLYLRDLIKRRKTLKLEVSRSVISGEISVPGSKSHTIRAVAIATMATGISKIHRPLISGDTLSSLNAASAFGAGIDKQKISGQSRVLPENLL